jgi:hypothetical protein
MRLPGCTLDDTDALDVGGNDDDDDDDDADEDDLILP